MTKTPPLHQPSPREDEAATAYAQQLIDLWNNTWHREDGKHWALKPLNDEGETS